MQDRINSLPAITKNLIIVNVLMFLATMSFPVLSSKLALFSVVSSEFTPYQIVTHMFMHANITHILFNMFALFMFGGVVERALGHQRFLFYYIATGLGAAFLQSAVNYVEIQQAMQGLDPRVISMVIADGRDLIEQELNYSAPVIGNLNSLVNIGMVGASGAVFGLLAAFGMLYPNQTIYLLFPPIPIKAKYFVLGYGAIELYLGMTGRNPGVAHFAHLGGAIFGALMILYWRKQGERF